MRFSYHRSRKTRHPFPPDARTDAELLAHRWGAFLLHAYDVDDLLIGGMTPPHPFRYHVHG